MTITTNDDWTWSTEYDYRVKFATTSDPRVVAVIKRDDMGGSEVIDGDVYAPAFWVGSSAPLRPAGSTFMDDVSKEIADSYLGARAYFVNRHYVKGGRQMDYDAVTARYLRIFHDTTAIEVDSILILNTPTWREHVGITGYDESTLDGDAESWQATLDGDVFGIGFAVNEDRLDPDEEVDLNDGSWEVEMQVWGFLGEEYAQQSAAAFEDGEPDLGAVEGPREYLVSYSMNIEAMSAEEAARDLARHLVRPGVPARGSYDVQRGKKTVTVDLGEGQF